MTIDTNETRFHALKFAIQNRPGDHALCLVKDAEAFAAFLDGQPAPAAPATKETVELADLTESYPADEPVAVIDSPQDEEVAYTGPDVAEELFDAPAEVSVTLLGDAEYVDWLRSHTGMPDTSQATGSVFGSADLTANVPLPQPEPTFEYVAAAVEQIADPAPVIEDATEQPEMTDEQVERLEQQTAEALAQDTRPEAELETAGFYVNRLPRKTFPWIG